MYQLFDLQSMKCCYKRLTAPLLSHKKVFFWKFGFREGEVFAVSLFFNSRECQKLKKKKEKSQISFYIEKTDGVMQKYCQTGLFEWSHHRSSNSEVTTAIHVCKPNDLQWTKQIDFYR